MEKKNFPTPNRKRIKTMIMTLPPQLDLVAGRIAGKAFYYRAASLARPFLWCKGQSDPFVAELEEPVSVRRIVTKIMAAHHIKARPHAKGISGGDPFVIASGKGWRRALDRRRRRVPRQH